MKRTAVLVLLTAIIISMCSACAIVQTPYDNVFIVPNTVKYTRDETVQQTGRDVLIASMAKNEREGVQFILNFEENVTDVHIEVSDVTDGQTSLSLRVLSGVLYTLIR